MLLLIGSGCATKSNLQPVVLLDGRHVTTFKAGQKIEMVAPTLSGVSNVFVVTDVGMKMMYGLDVTPPKAEK